jgi:hypothetical protein
MTITAKSADGILHNFPDDTDTAVIDRVMKQYAQSIQTRVQPEKKPEEKPEETPSIKDQIFGIPAEITKGFTRGVTVDPLSGASSLAYNAARAADPSMARFEDTGFGKKLAKAQEYLAPNDSGMITQIASGFGSLASLVPGGALKGGLKAITLGAQAGGWGSEEARARADQATIEGKPVSAQQQLASQAMAVPVGLLELLPVERLARPIKAIFSKVKLDDIEQYAPSIFNKIKRIAGTGSIEAVQEATSNIIQDLIQKGVYDPTLEVGQSALANAEIGGAVGALAQTAVELVTRGKMKQNYNRLKQEEGEKKIAEQVQAIKDKQDAKDKETRERLGIDPNQLYLPAPPKQIEEDKTETDAVMNPIGLIADSELPPKIVKQINAKRKAEGKNQLQNFSIEDLADAQVPKKIIDNILTSKTNFTGEKTTKQDVESVAKNRNIDTQSDGFLDFLARTTGSRDLSVMTQPQLHAALKSLSSMSKTETPTILPTGTNAKRFTQTQYDEAVDDIKFNAFKDAERLGRSAIIERIKDFAGFENNSDAESLLNTAVKNGEFSLVKKPIYHVVNNDGSILRSYITKDSASKAASKENLLVRDDFSVDVAKPDSVSSIDSVSTGAGFLKMLKEDIGLDIREGQFKQGVAPTAFEITRSDGVRIGTPHASMEAAEKAATTNSIFRLAEAKKLLREANKIPQAIEKNNNSLERMQSLGVSETDFRKASDNIAAKNKQLEATAKKLRAEAEVYAQPLIIAPKGENVISKKGFTYFENDAPVATFDSREQAEKSLLARRTDAELATIVEKATKKGGATANRIIGSVQQEMSDRAGTSPKGIKVRYKGSRKKAEEKLSGVGGAGVFTPELRVAAEQLSAKLRPLLDRLGLKELRLNMVTSITTPSGDQADGEYSKALIKISLLAEDPMRTLNHEAIHALKELGAFTKDQWRVLSNKAKSEWIETYNIKARYSGLDAEGQIEEAIADAFSDFAINPQPGMMGAIVAKIKNFFEALKNSMNDLGFQTYQDVFSDVATGNLSSYSGKATTLGDTVKYMNAPVKGAALDIPSIKDIRPPKENLSTITSSLSNNAKVIGDETVNIDTLQGGIGQEVGDIKRVDDLAKKLSTKGSYIERLIVDDAGNVIEGQHRLDALRKLGVKEVPIVRIKDYMRDFPSDVKDTIRSAQKMPSDQVNQLESMLAEIYAQENGNISEIMKYDVPKGYEAAWSAAINVLKRNGMTAEKATASDKKYSIKAPASAIGFYSPIEKAALNLSRSKGTGLSFLNDLKKGDSVTRDELTYTGIEDWLKSKQNLTKQEVQDYIANNKVDVQEVVLDDRSSEFQTKHYKWQLPNGDKYTEIMLTLPMPQNLSNELKAASKKAKKLSNRAEKLRIYWSQGSNIYKELQVAREDAKKADKALQDLLSKIDENTYESSHWDEPNVLAHIRISHRIDANGKKTTLIEEIQSDWHQDGRKYGYATDVRAQRDKIQQERKILLNKQDEYLSLAEPYTSQGKDAPQDVIEGWTNTQNKLQELQRQEDRINATENAVPDAPFKEDWYKLALKRAIKEAVDNGSESISLTTGKRQIERFSDSLRQRVDEINFRVFSPGTVGDTESVITAAKDGDRKFTGTVSAGKFNSGVAMGKTIAEVFGKSIATKIQNHDPSQGEGVIKGDDLSIGGEGMKKYYDEIYPAFLNSFGKKYDVKVEDNVIPIKDAFADELPNSREKVRTLPITPKMSEDVRKGQRMFSITRRINVDGVSRSTVNNKGQAIAATDEKLNNFWRWFGDSKVVDADGNPMVMYHGTDAEFDIFDVKAAKKNRGTNFEGVYTTPDKLEAETFGKNVIGLYVKSANPYSTGKSPVTKEMAAKYAKVLNFYPGYKDDSIRFIISYFKKSGVFKDIDGALKTDVVKAGGYDSYIDGPHVVVFSSDQVKPVSSEATRIEPKRVKTISKETAKKVLESIVGNNKGSNLISDLVDKNPLLRKLSQDYLRNKHGDTITVYRSLGLTGDLRTEKIVSTTDDANVAINMNNDIFDLITKNDFISPKRTLLRYDIPIENVKAYVPYLLDISSDVIKSMKEKTVASGGSGRRIPIDEILDAGKRESEVVADLGGISPSQVLDMGTGSGKKFEIIRSIKSGNFDPSNIKEVADWVDPVGFSFTPKTKKAVEDLKNFAKDAERFLSGSSDKKSGTKYSIRDRIPQNIQADINRTTHAREEVGYPKRIMAAVTPEGFQKHLLRFRQSYINRYESIERLSKRVAERFGIDELLAHTSAAASALFSDRAAGVTASVLVNGVPVYRDGMTTVSDFDGKVKGLISILEPLAKRNDPFIYQAFQYYAGVKRGGRLAAEGRENLFTNKDGAAYAAALEREFPEFVDVLKEYQKFNNGLVQYMKDTGVISAKDADLWTKNWDYIPFYRQMEGERTSGPQLFQSISGVSKPKELKGGTAKVDDFLETVVRNTRAAVEAGMKNVAAQRVIRDVVRMDEGEKVRFNHPDASDIVSIKVNGVTEKYRVRDPLLVESLKSLDMPEIPGLALFSKPADLLRNLVTKDPGFILVNLMRDSLSAYITSGTDMKPFIDTFKQFGNTLADSSPEVLALKKSGFFTGYEFSGDTQSSSEATLKELRKRTGTRTTAEKTFLPLTAMWGMLEKGSNASDLATRAEIYKRTLAETGNEAEALFRALEVMNFGRKGSSAGIRVLSAIIPFFNARIQGLDVLYRAGFGQGVVANRERAQKSFMIRAMTMFALSSMYWFMASDDEEYEKASQETKDNNWIIEGFKIPIPFELGVIFKVIPERLLAYYFGNDTGKDLREAMLRNLTSTMQVNLPQAILPVVETMANYSFFTGEPIVGMGTEGLEKKYQYTASTSTLAKKIGEKAASFRGAFGLPILPESPQLIDNLIKGYTGTLGTYAVMAIDSIMANEGEPVKATLKFEQLPVFKRFLASKDATGTVSSYYDLKEEVEKAVQTMNMLERTGDYEGMKEYFKGEKGNLIAIRPYINALDKNISELRDLKRMIQSSRMSGDRKRDTLTSITRAENSITARIQDIKKFVYK